jgi:hypothetical protein
MCWRAFLVSGGIATVSCSSPAAPIGSLSTCTYAETEVTYNGGGDRDSSVGDAELVADYAPACWPIALSPDALGRVPCMVLVTLATAGGESTCASVNFQVPDANTLYRFRVHHGDGLPSDRPVCKLSQLLGTDLSAQGDCSMSRSPGWCYVTGAAAEGCLRAIHLSPSAEVPGADFWMACETGC